MNTNDQKTSRDSKTLLPDKKAKYPIHPYFTSNSSEETIRRMRGIKERIAKFKEQLDADRKADKG